MVSPLQSALLNTQILLRDTGNADLMESTALLPRLQELPARPGAVAPKRRVQRHIRPAMAQRLAQSPLQVLSSSKKTRPSAEQVVFSDGTRMPLVPRADWPQAAGHYAMGGRLGGGSARMPSWRPGKLPPLREHQTRFIESLIKDHYTGKYPWLAVTSPMQTGKSHLTGPLIDRLSRIFGPTTRYLILSSSEVITDQIVTDLLKGYPATEVGRYDGNIKLIKRVTVASAPSVYLNLADFTHDGPTVVINDEASSTQQERYQVIYEHLGLGQRVKGKGGTKIIPKEGKGIVIGYSGTGNGLDGYHISARYPLDQAIKDKRVRHMIGHRRQVTIESDQKRNTEEGAQIWWRPTEANAEFIARVYAEEMGSKYEKTLVYAPTIQHGRLLKEALNKLYGSKVHFIHSRQEDLRPDEVTAVPSRWERDGGILIAVKKLNHGFRGTGVEAVFHTYQTQSIELFAQRTGRAWGQPENGDLPDLFVLELAWSLKNTYANLPRLFGMLDYSGEYFETRKIPQEGQAPKTAKSLAVDFEGRVRLGEVNKYFWNIPLMESWVEALKPMTDLEREARIRGLAPHLLEAYRTGLLPFNLRHVKRLSEFLGGNPEVALRRWFDDWLALLGSDALKDHPGLKQEWIQYNQLLNLAHNPRELIGGFIPHGVGLETWFNAREIEAAGQMERRAILLHLLLHRIFAVAPAFYHLPVSRALEDFYVRVYESKPAGMTAASFREVFDQAFQWMKSETQGVWAEILDHHYLSPRPLSANQMAASLGWTPSRLSMEKDSLESSLYKNYLRDLTEVSESERPILPLPLSRLAISPETGRALFALKRRNVGSLILHPPYDIFEALKPDQMEELNRALTGVGVDPGRLLDEWRLKALLHQALDACVDFPTFRWATYRRLTGLAHFGDLVGQSVKNLERRGGVQARALVEEVQKALAEKGLWLGMPTKGWLPPELAQRGRPSEPWTNFEKSLLLTETEHQERRETMGPPLKQLYRDFIELHVRLIAARTPTRVNEAWYQKLRAHFESVLRMEALNARSLEREILERLYLGAQDAEEVPEVTPGRLKEIHERILTRVKKSPYSWQEAHWVKPLSELGITGEAETALRALGVQSAADIHMLDTYPYLLKAVGSSLEALNLFPVPRPLKKMDVSFFSLSPECRRILRLNKIHTLGQILDWPEAAREKALADKRTGPAQEIEALLNDFKED